MCYYFDHIINGTEINFSNILLDKKLYKKLISIKNVVLQIVLIIILERSEFIYIILYLLKKTDFSILIKSVIISYNTH